MILTYINWVFWIWVFIHKWFIKSRITSYNVCYTKLLRKSIEKNEKTNYLEDIRARLSLTDYSTLSNIRDDNHRIVTRFSLNADHINNSKYSVETYLNYRKDISVV